VLLPPDDPDAWRQAILRLIENSAERDRLAAMARARAQRFTLARTARRYRALYGGLIRERTERQVA
jgi:glycosyltransferase involved in cell wall biosynthesis